MNTFSSTKKDTENVSSVLLDDFGHFLGRFLRNFAEEFFKSGNFTANQILKHSTFPRLFPRIFVGKGLQMRFSQLSRLSNTVFMRFRSGSFRFIIRSISWLHTRNSATRYTNLIYHRFYRIQHSGPRYSSWARLSSVFMRLLKERKQNSCTPCAKIKIQGFEKKGGAVKLKCSIFKVEQFRPQTISHQSQDQLCRICHERKHKNNRPSISFIFSFCIHERDLNSGTLSLHSYTAPFVNYGQFH